MSNETDFIVSIYQSAKSISQKTGMSLELMLAQAAQETGWGQKILPETNNIFNIKADSSWSGKSATFLVPEYIDGKYVTVESKFRVYDSYEDAFSDRVLFLQSNKRYSDIFKKETLGNFEAEAKVLQNAGYATDPNYSANLIKVFNGRTMKLALLEAGNIEKLTLNQETSIGNTSTGNGAEGGLGESGATAATAATVPARRDPLVLDLDGDGIETTSSREGTVVLFDHDADGVKTGTGWVKPDDGWLVMDRNGNGTIDSGRELFGVDTMKNNGSLAVDGFDALKDFDANKDGQINASDAMFSNLKIWRDLNQDGISQSNELSTLASNSITAIGVKASAVSNDLGNGNIQTAAGTFTRSNGSTGSTGETNSEAGNLDLLVDTFHREFTDHITLTAQAKALPDLKGSGQVRDLSEAISLSSTLGNTVQTYAQQTTRDAQISRLDGLIEQWANTSNMKSIKAQADALTSNGVSLTYDLQGLTAGSAEYTTFIKKLGIVERFMGFTYGGQTGQARFTALSANEGHLTVTLAPNQISSIELAYEHFKGDIYESLLLPTRLSKHQLNKHTSVATAH